MIKKNILIIIVALFCIFILILSLLIFKVNIAHTIYPSLIQEYTLEQEYCETYGKDGYCYFFVQSDEHYCFNGDGVEELKRYVPQYDVSNLDTDNYNYIVAINCEINSLNYSYKTAYKTTGIGIDTYVADADLIKTHDNTVRIYKMKKINIDYAFKKYGPPGTNFAIIQG